METFSQGIEVLGKDIKRGTGADRTTMDQHERRADSLLKKTRAETFDVDVVDVLRIHGALRLFLITQIDSAFHGVSCGALTDFHPWNTDFIEGITIALRA